MNKGTSYEDLSTFVIISRSQNENDLG